MAHRLKGRGKAITQLPCPSHTWQMFVAMGLPDSRLTPPQTTTLISSSVTMAASSTPNANGESFVLAGDIEYDPGGVSKRLGLIVH